MTEILRLEDFSTQDNNILEKLHSTTSKGAQPKWRNLSTGLFIKQDYHGTESIAEWTVFKILDECSNLSKERIVPYHLCTVDGIAGCYSPDFKKDEDEITLTDILDLQANDLNLLFKKKNPAERFEALQKVIHNHTQKDFDYELKLMFAVDAFFLNEDRHTSNISVLEDAKGEYRLSPIFDNGMALLSRTKEYPYTTPVAKNIDKVKPVLLSTRFKKHIELYNYEPFLFRDKVDEFIEQYKEELGRVYSVLRFQLRQPHIQKLFIKQKVGLASSNIFS